MPFRCGLLPALTIIAVTVVGYRLGRDRPAAGPAGMPVGGTGRRAAPGGVRPGGRK